MSQTFWSAGPWLEIVVPARNEEARLPRGLASLCAALAALPPGVAVIVVDSASTDGTADVVRHWPAGDAPISLVRHPRPGKGAAVRAGLLATTAPYVGFCDADMAADPVAVEVAVGLLLDGHQLVLGSRAHPESYVVDRRSAVRRAGATIFHRLARPIVPGVGDTQCGFKFFSGPLARTAGAGLRARGYAFDVELISRCRQLGAEPVEIPVSWRDMPGSTFSAWRHSLVALTEIAIIPLALRAPSRWPATAPAGTPGPADGSAVPADFTIPFPVRSESV